ncbi:MAG: hypothetical protein NZ988_00705 [Thaumarchaeota archaeon]|nr:hypothetical protein [Candidatus Calditenuaceae archaeon]MDW8186554.1 hypothetical protein [Nitrososphaerota archaeon]
MEQATHSTAKKDEAMESIHVETLRLQGVVREPYNLIRLPRGKGYEVVAAEGVIAMSCNCTHLLNTSEASTISVKGVQSPTAVFEVLYGV